MKKMINKITIEGLYYEDNLKESEDNFINGKLSVLTSSPDGEITNVCETRVIAGPKYGNKKDSKDNPNYNKFKYIMEQNNNKSYLQIGKEALGINISGSLDANYFIPKDKEKNRENVINSTINKASFITILENKIPKEPKAEFETDIVITKIIPEMTKETEDEPSIETGNYLVQGYIFDFNNVAIEVTYIAKKSEDGSLSAADYFADLATELPVFTKVWGNINGFITVVEKEELSAFGSSKKVSFKITKKEYEITGALAIPYEEGLTDEEYNQSLQLREQKIAASLERQSKNENNFSNLKGENTEDIASSFDNILSGKKFNF